ncbi:UNVERIFIED_CONTAM: hypothetical protein Slati_0657200 [Sesamum latifolium]|uniref:Yippee domain-containing protein n=1 Tax=Sesamum latifolium TaxID=2727402 RepID=A0AAW2Y3G9_9LAMI
MVRTGHVLVEFDEEFPDYYMCKSCRTHIALEKDLDSLDVGAELFGAIFKSAVNLRVDDPDDYRQVAGNTVADVYCIYCNDKLGWQYFTRHSFKNQLISIKNLALDFPIKAALAGANIDQQMARTGYVLVEFDEEFPDYYMCKSCRTHIALAEDFDSFDAGAELFGAIFSNA